jgi:hypothetical protein
MEDTLNEEHMEEKEAAAEVSSKKTTGSEDYDTSGRGSFDASGRGDMTAGSDVIPDGIAQANQASIAAKGLAYEPATVFVPQMGAEEVAEHLGVMFDGQDLSEEFMTRAGTIFEAAVNSKINDLAQQLDESYRAVLTEQLEEVVGNLAEKLDDYLNYVVEEWIGKNELALERGIKTDVAESFITGLKSLFEAHYVNVPDERYDVLDELFESNEQLQNDLNAEMEANVALKSQLNETVKAQLFAHYTQGLADTEVEKFSALAEAISFEDAQSFNNKLAQLHEAYFEQSAPVSQPVELIEETTNQKISNGSAMDRYVDTLGFHMRKH